MVILTIGHDVETYHKIQTLFKRRQDGSKKGKMIRGEWTTPELEYLKDNEWTFSAKVDGTNIRILLSRVEDDLRCIFAGRSNNASIPEPLLNYLRETFKDSPSGSGESAHIGRWMVENDLTAVTLFGEGYGPKIQGGGKYRNDHSFILFDVKVGDFWLSRENVADVAQKLGVDVVPEIGRGTLQDAIDIVGTGLTFNSFGKPIRWGGASTPNGLKSQWGDFYEEGIVARPVVDMFDRKGQRIICKIKHVDLHSQ